MTNFVQREPDGNEGEETIKLNVRICPSTRREKWTYEKRRKPIKCPTSRPFLGLPKMWWVRLIAWGQIEQMSVKTHCP